MYHSDLRRIFRVARTTAVDDTSLSIHQGTLGGSGWVPNFPLVVGWVGLDQSADRLGWIGSHKVDEWTTLSSRTLRNHLAVANHRIEHRRSLTSEWLCVSALGSYT